jgi:hypothetical protein
MEVFNGSQVVGRHTGPAPRAMCAKVMDNAAWKMLMSWNRSWYRDLGHSIYALYRQMKKDAFKISRVDPQIFKGVMSHSIGLSLNMSDHLLAA